MKQKTVAIFTSCEGHLSLAQAAGEALTHEHQVVFFQEIDELFSLYVLLYQFFPAGHKIPFTISKHRTAMNLLQKSFHRRYRTKLLDFIDKHRPDVLINTYFMYNPVLEAAAAERSIPFYNIITDPKTVHPLIISPSATANLAFNKDTIDTVNQELVQPNRVKSVGWFVRDHFESAYDKAAVRQDLRLHPTMLTFLVAAGSEGTTHILKILPALFQASRPLQIIIACGNNKTLFRSAQALKGLLKRSGSPHKVLPLKFTTVLHKYMQAADLIIGKAGPNSVFEAVATETPFFAITHISGQEDGNLDIIRDFKLGYIEENPLKATKLLESIINNPDTLNQFATPLKKMADYNRGAKPKLRSLVESSQK